MKILFIGKRYINDFDSGVEKKLTNQILALEKLGHEVFYTGYEEGFVYLYGDNTKIKLLKANNFDNTLMQIYYVEKSIIKAFELLNKKIDLCYIRKSLANPYHLSILKKLKDNNTKIIEEIPTYPYDLEFETRNLLTDKIWILIDKSYRNKLKKYVSHFVTYSNDTEIFGAKAVQISNGVNISDYSEYKNPKYKNELHLITVSQMSFWHGYDRLLKGLAEYYKSDFKIKVFIHMVGDGVEKKKLEKIALDNNIKKYVKFYGLKSGEELTEIFNKCNMAVASLGVFRKNIFLTSELKIREYTLRGIPFAYASKDTDIKEDVKWAKKVSEDETFIDINDIVLFYKNNIEENDDISKEMQNFAKENLTWDKQIEKALGEKNVN